MAPPSSGRSGSDGQRNATSAASVTGGPTVVGVSSAPRRRPGSSAAPSGRRAGCWRAGATAPRRRPTEPPIRRAPGLAQDARRRRRRRTRLAGGAAARPRPGGVLADESGGSPSSKLEKDQRGQRRKRCRIVTMPPSDRRAGPTCGRPMSTGVGPSMPSSSVGRPRSRARNSAATSCSPATGSRWPGPWVTWADMPANDTWKIYLATDDITKTLERGGGRRGRDHQPGRWRWPTSAPRLCSSTRRARTSVRGRRGHSRASPS